MKEFGQTDQHLSGVVDRVTLKRALKQLPPGYRKIFLLHDLLGYEHHEIAQALGRSDGTCKSQLHKARMRLRTLLKGCDGTIPMATTLACDRPTCCSSPELQFGWRIAAL